MLARIISAAEGQTQFVSANEVNNYNWTFSCKFRQNYLIYKRNFV